jgi:hypothetical protein
MTDLAITVKEARPDRHAAAPTLLFVLQVRETAARAIHAILLRCQLQIEPQRRRHAAGEKERLTDLFGTADRWAETLHPLIWSRTGLSIPAFTGSVEVELPVACTYDLEVGAAKYLYALEGGEVPLRLLFSGTVFAKTETGFAVEQVPWDKEAIFRLPLRTWRELMDSYFPGSAWIRLRHESLDALLRFRTRNALVSWEDTIDALLAAAEAPVR